MTKLHEIPIYALSENELSKRYERFKDSFWENSPPIDEETFKRCIEHETHPQRCWNHNHVVGSIDILLDKQDIVFEIYLPYPEVKRYDWRRSRKIYVHNIMANGTHFYIKSEMSNSDIQAQLSDSVARGNPTDDVKSAANDICTEGKKLLGITACGNNGEAIMRDTLAKLITPDMTIYQTLESEIFG